MSRTKNIIPEFTKPEIDYIIENANFTKEERMLFTMRNSDYSLEYCSEIIGVSISTLSKRINKRMMNKIMRVIAHMDI